MYYLIVISTVEKNKLRKVSVGMHMYMHGGSFILVRYGL